MRFTPDVLRNFIFEVQTTGSVTPSLMKLLLQGVPAFSRLPEQGKDAIIKALTSNHLPMTEAAFESLARQETSLFKEAKQIAMSTREFRPRRPKEDSPWWKEYLASNEIREDLRNNNKSKDSIEFRRLFRIPFALFETLLDVTINKGFYDRTATDANGKPCSNLELLLLGVLFLLGKDADNQMASKMSYISEEVHRKFHHRWCAFIAHNSSDYIYMPTDNEELEYVESRYARFGLVGCVGLIDCVHIGWDACCAGDCNLFTGKEKYPSIAYEVICSNDRKILSVTRGFPGSRGDKSIVKCDETVRSLRAFKLGLDPLLDGTSWLSRETWTVRTSIPGSTRTFTGKYFICDGGYLQWPCLVCGVPDADDLGLMELCKVIGAVRKDIECVFGTLKKRFKSLKTWSKLQQQQTIDDGFVTCCVLHNMLLSIDGYLNDDKNDVVPDGPAMRAVALKNTGCRPEAMRVRRMPVVEYDGTEIQDDVSNKENSDWLVRLRAIGEHILSTQHLVLTTDD